MILPKEAEHESSHNRLDKLFYPKSVAIIGASEKEGSVGLALVENMRSFGGSVFYINSKRKTLFDKPSYPSLAALPEPVDLVVIATPAAAVPDLIDQCASGHVGAAIIISAGFKECGPQGAKLEQEILCKGRKSGMRFLGPNCLGLMLPRTGLNATFAAGMAIPGNIAFVSQSGALTTAILDWSLREKVGISAMVSIGSMLDIGWGDLITYLGDDPATKSILCYMESVGDARAFLSAAREVALTKPIIILKVGRTAEAAKAAISHTGSLTGSDDVLDMAFGRVGVLRVNSIGELFDMAAVLGKQPAPKGPNLTIVTNAGGAGALATDALVKSGGKLAPVSPAAMESFNQLLPPHWSHGNPVDILGDADANRYEKAVQLAAEDDSSNGILAVLTPQAMTESTATAIAAAKIARTSRKPFLASWMGGASVEEGRRILTEAGIPVYDCPDTAANVFAAMWRYAENLRSIYQTPEAVADFVSTEPRLKVEHVLNNLRKGSRTLLNEVEAKSVLSAYNIPTVPTWTAETCADAIAMAEQLGYPVVLKLNSNTLTHKSDVGGVQLNLNSARDVRKAWARIEENVSKLAGAEHFQGVTVQPMVQRSGYELLLGSSTDAQFGPVLVFGTGGQLVETFQDRALALPPLNANLAQRMIESTRIYQALKGVRGQKPVNIKALIEIIIRFSHLVAEQPEIAEIEMNPLLASSDQLIALDARVVLHPLEELRELPKLAIRPYPAKYITRVSLKNGACAVVRPIRPEDEPLMVQFHQTLSENTVYLRYFTHLKLDQRVIHERLSKLCFIDYDREMALVVEHDGGGTGRPQIIAVGRLTKLHGQNAAEFALLVADHWQNQGIGSRLLKLLIHFAKDEKIERIVGHVLSENPRMRAIANRLGFRIKHVQDGPQPVELLLD